jgi:hypothetical protein
MITPSYVRTMAAYNAEMNNRLYDAAERLGEAERRRDRGAFWHSLHGTLVHILWGDAQWMSRFDGWERPATPIKQSDPRTGPSCARRARRPTMTSRAGRRRSTTNGLTRIWCGSAAPHSARSARRSASSSPISSTTRPTTAARRTTHHRRRREDRRHRSVSGGAADDRVAVVG